LNDQPNRDDLLKDIVSDYEGRQEEHQEEKEKREHRQGSSAVRRKVLIFSGVLLIVILTMRLIFIITADSGIYQEPRYWAVGRWRSSDPRMNECLSNMWQMRRAADRYYAANKKFPSTAEVITEKESVCPSSGKPYSVKNREGRAVFYCPTPEKHGVDEVWCAVRTGPPVVEKK